MQFLIEWHKLNLIARFPPSTTQHNTREPKKETHEKNTNTTESKIMSSPIFFPCFFFYFFVSKFECLIWKIT